MLLEESKNDEVISRSVIVNPANFDEEFKAIEPSQINPFSKNPATI